jgi:SAM-dependent methyltransferase
MIVTLARVVRRWAHRLPPPVRLAMVRLARRAPWSPAMRAKLREVARASAYPPPPGPAAAEAGGAKQAIVSLIQPSPPPDLVEHVSGDRSVESFMGSFPHVRYEVKRHLALAGYDFRGFENILDFGCGPGRFLLAFQPELGPHQRVYGCDVCADCADWSQKNLTFAEIQRNRIEPPLPYADGQFGLVYSLSVFTHLRLDLQFRWAWEIHRILRPGGVFFASFHGPYFFDMYHELFRRGAARAVEISSLGDDGLFCYLDFTVRPEDQGQKEVAAAHSPRFAEEIFASLELVKRFPQTVMAGGQDVYIWKKPESAPPIAMPRPDAGHVWKTRVSRQARDADALVIPFQLDGQQTFRVYPCVQPAGIYAVECQVEVRTKERVLTTACVPFNNNRVFGGSHHAVVAIPVTSWIGEAAVQLRAEVADWGTLSGECSVEIAWDFPHFD